MASKSAGSKRRAEDAFQASMQAAIARVVQGSEARDADLVYGRVRGDGHRHYLDADLEDEEGDEEEEDDGDVAAVQKPAKKVQLPPPTASSSSSSSSSSQSASYASASIEAAFRAGREFGNSEQLPRPPCPVCKLRKERNRVAARESRLKKKNGAPTVEAPTAAPAITPKYGGKGLMMIMKMESPKAQVAEEDEEEEEEEEEEAKGPEVPMQPPPF
jgi:hypothetical protein